MKKVLMLGTGGTIASEVTPSGLAPALTSAEELFSIDSTNVTPAHWLTIARAIRAHYEEYDGFVIAHGTDTMAYTAAALSYLIQYSPKPIILTGAQKPIVFENTDSKTNLADAFRCAVSAPAHAKRAPSACRPSPASTIRSWPCCRTAS